MELEDTISLFFQACLYIKKVVRLMGVGRGLSVFALNQPGDISDAN